MQLLQLKNKNSKDQGGIIDDAMLFLGYLQRLPLNFFLYITFLHHIINILSPIFHPPQRFPLFLPPIPHYNHKIPYYILLFIYY